MIKRAALKARRALGHPSPACALILGSGWGEAAQALDISRSVGCADIPGMGPAGIEGHRGIISLAAHAGLDLLIFQGRRHWHEGAGWEPVAFPVGLCLDLRVPILLVTNAAGGIRPDLAPGDLMVVDDHINAMGANPLVGGHGPWWGPRFADQTEVYDHDLSGLLDQAGAAVNVALRHGVYLAASGPAYETPAEVAAFRALGADAVGMSTVPEAMLAHAAGIRVAALSCIANRAAGCAGGPLSHEEVLRTTAAAAPRMRAMLLEFIRLLAAALPHEHSRPQPAA